MCNRHCWGPCLLVKQSHCFVCRGSFCTPCPACSASTWGRADRLPGSYRARSSPQPATGRGSLSAFQPPSPSGDRVQRHAVCSFPELPSAAEPHLPTAGPAYHSSSIGFFLSASYVPTPLSGLLWGSPPKSIICNHDVCFWDIMCLDCLKHIILFNLCPTLAW